MADTPKHSLNLICAVGEAQMIDAMFRPHQAHNADLSQSILFTSWFFGAAEPPLSTHPGNAFFFEMD